MVVMGKRRCARMSKNPFGLRKLNYCPGLEISKRFIEVRNPVQKQMDGRCCAIEESPRPQRRINGLQLPLHYQQVIAWIVFLVTALINIFIMTSLQFEVFRNSSVVIFGLLYMLHIISHACALLMDPSEKDLRKMKVQDVPEFDRSIHAHVIENGRCHLCNIYTSSKKTKHCSLCNKCVDRFDHHCKWLNNCVGRRNYAAFMSCVSTALLISTFTAILCLTDIIFFFTNPKNFSYATQEFINCSVSNNVMPDKYCEKSIWFLIFLFAFCITSLTIGGALLHLCCFHVYITILGVSTYEYIVKVGTSNAPEFKCSNAKKCFVSRKLYKVSKKKNPTVNSDQQDNAAIENHSESRTSPDMADLIGILINNEFDKARKLFLKDKNKIHPDSSGG